MYLEHYSLSPGTYLFVRVLRAWISWFRATLMDFYVDFHLTPLFTVDFTDKLLILTAFDSGHIINALETLEVEILDFEHLSNQWCCSSWSNVTCHFRFESFNVWRALHSRCSSCDWTYWTFCFWCRYISFFQAYQCLGGEGGSVFNCLCKQRVGGQ